jgi:hypothetical protein
MEMSQLLAAKSKPMRVEFMAFELAGIFIV